MINFPKRVDVLLIVRGLASISVIFWHLGGYLMREDYLSSFFIVPGRLAVWLFFMMSGYLIGYGLIYGKYRESWDGIRRFYFNRLLRIYPIFLVVSLVSLILLYSDITVNLGFIAQEFLMLQWRHDYQLNEVFWTLGVEAHLYLIAPFLVFGFQAIFGKSKKWLLYLIVLILFWLYAQTHVASYNKNSVDWDIRSFMGGISHFTLGIMLAGYKDKIIQMGSKKFFIAFVSLLTLTFLMYFNHKNDLSFDKVIVSHLIGAGIIMLHVVVESRAIKAGFGVKLLMILGVLSYGIYAWHGLLTINGIFVDNLLVHLALCLILAYTTYLLVERPLLAFRL